MKSKILKGTTTFLFVTAIMTATTFNFANESNMNILPSSNNKIQTQTINEKYFGSYLISSNSINHFAKDYLINNLNVQSTNTDYSLELNLLINALNKSEILREDLLGELRYTIDENKLVIKDIAGGESFNLDYEIKDNILYAKVYDYTQELAIGKFEDNGRFLIVKSPNNDNTVFLEHNNA